MLSKASQLLQVFERLASALILLDVFQGGAKAGHRFLGGTHMAGDFLTQVLGCPGKRPDRLMQEAVIGRIDDVGFQRGRINSDFPGFDRLRLHQVFDQLLVEFPDPFFAEALVQFDECCGIGHRIHQVQMTEIPPGEALADFGLHFFVTEAPAEFQKHHPEVHIDRGARSTHGGIKHGFEWLDKLTLRKK